MTEWLKTHLPEWSHEWVDPLLMNLAPITRAVVTVIFGFIFARLLLKLLRSAFAHQFSAQTRLIVRKVVNYGTAIIVGFVIAKEFGFNLTTILGAAGIAGIAIGFAAQTSLSNIISGIFMLWEKPFQVGDAIKIGEIVGIVESLDLLSLRLRTLDNLLIRIPNETIVKNHLTNITYHPIRRFDIKVGASYDSDIDHVLDTLRGAATDNRLVLEEPSPLICVTGYGDSSIDFMIGVWHEKDDFIETRNTILRDIKKRFDREGIQIPFPHRVMITDQSRELAELETFRGTEN